MMMLKIHVNNICLYFTGKPNRRSMSCKELPEDDEDDENETLNEEVKCPGCHKTKKNVLLHIQKSVQCKSKVSEEEFIKLTNRSKKIRRLKVRLNVAKCNKKARLKDNDKVKADQNKRKMKSRTQAKKEVSEEEKDMNYYFKLKKRNETKNIKIEEGQPVDSWKIEDGSCPSCRKKKKNVLLHLKKSHVCKAIVSPDQMNELIFESEDIARKRVKRYREKKAQNVKNEIYRKEKENSQTENLDGGDEKPICDQSEAYSSEEEAEETMKEMQNRWKATSREKARKKDHAALKKYQRENTAKCRKKQKQEDIELYLAKQQLLRLKDKDIQRPYDLMKVPKNLIKNYHRLNKYYNDSDNDSDDGECFAGLTVKKQMKVLNDDNLNRKEKMEKLKTLMEKREDLCDHFPCAIKHIKFCRHDHIKSIVQGGTCLYEGIPKCLDHFRCRYYGYTILRCIYKDLPIEEIEKTDKKDEEYIKVNEDQEKHGIWRISSWMPYPYDKIKYPYRIDVDYDEFKYLQSVQITEEEAEEMRKGGLRAKDPFNDTEVLTEALKDKFKNEGRLQGHKVKKEDNDPDYQCPDCKITFQTQFRLEKHIQDNKHGKYKNMEITGQVLEEMHNELKRKVAADRKNFGLDDDDNDDKETEENEESEESDYGTDAWLRRKLLREGYELSDEESEEEEEEENTDITDEEDDP